MVGYNYKQEVKKINTTEEGKSEGKFHALLKFRANAGDEILKDHLEMQQMHNLQAQKRRIS